jgi:hypothetical protein
MRRSGILVESRPIRYREKQITLPDGSIIDVDTSQEKGIDIRIALDVIRMTMLNNLDVAVIFSQDQDLAEVALEVKDIAKNQKRWIKVCSAFPHGNNATTSRGINNTDWIRMDQTFYNSCLDHKDYRLKKSNSN